MAGTAAGIDHSESSFTGVGGLRLFSQAWRSSDWPPRALLVVLHGLKDHSSRYGELAAAMVKRGFLVSAFDHRGHGRSDGRRVYVNKFDDYLSDVRTFLKMERDKNPGLPVFLFGHSMGGTMTAIAAIDGGADLQGIVLSAAALMPGESVSTMLVRVTRLLGAIAPGLPLMSLPNERFSRDPQVVAAMHADPLIYQKNGPVRTAAQFLNAMMYVRQNMEKLVVPALILHGTADKLTNPEGSKELAARAKSPDKTLKLYPGLVHDLVHEPEKDQVISDIAKWLDSHAPERPAASR
jgi:acylglycerol lipase